MGSRVNFRSKLFAKSISSSVYLRFQSAGLGCQLKILKRKTIFEFFLLLKSSNCSVVTLSKGTYCLICRAWTAQKGTFDLFSKFDQKTDR